VHAVCGQNASPIIFQFLYLRQSWLATLRVHSERPLCLEILPVIDCRKENTDTDQSKADKVEK
jgi:hypothetical protein